MSALKQSLPMITKESYCLFLYLSNVGRIVTTQEEHSLYILTESSRQDTGQKYQTA